ncbi:MAG: hypothetical protein WAO55_03235 [Candidatus Manganitrophaceae bacterium]
MMRRSGFFLVVLFLMLTEASVWAQGIPLMIPHTGTIAVGGTPFNGNGQFKFAIINGHADCNTSPPGANCAVYWSNDNTSTNGTAPTSAVTVSVSGGVFSVKLGDIALANMQAIPTNVFNNATTYLRVWFDDGVTGFQQLAPDRQLVSVPYAYHAETANSAPSGISVVFASAASTPTALTGSYQNVLQLTVNAPSAGSVIVTASGVIEVNHTAIFDQVSAGITTTSAGNPFPNWVYHGFPAALPTAVLQTNFSIQHVFSVPAGSSTFFLVSRRDSGTDTSTAWYSRITALFIP